MHDAPFHTVQALHSLLPTLHDLCTYTIAFIGSEESAYQWAAASKEIQLQGGCRTLMCLTVVAAIEDVLW